jgi:Transposase DDE domain group 1
VSPTHGEQEMSVWNGHYACTCYHPLFVFNQFGDLERCALRAGNVHSADGWDDVLKPVVARYQGKVSRIYFRADAAFAMPEVYEFLEAERIKYAIRLPANQVLQSRILKLRSATGKLSELAIVLRCCGPSNSTGMAPSIAHMARKAFGTGPDERYARTSGPSGE